MATIVEPGTGEVLGRTEEEAEDQGRYIRPFADWLIEQRKGELAVEMGEKLNELVEAVHDIDKGGTLTLKITIKPSGSGGGNIVIVTDDVVLKKPEAPRDAAIFFVDGQSNLSRANPAQPALPLREVPATSTNLKEVQQ